MFDLEEVCMNCAHWRRVEGTDNFGICHINAVNPDVGPDAKAIVYLFGNANCKQYDDAFEPDPEYLDYLRAVETQNDGL